MGLYQTKNLHSEGNLQQNKKATYWMGEYICKRYVMIRGWYLNYIRNSYNSITKNKQFNQKNGQRTWKDISPRKTYDGQQTYEKMLSITNHQENANQNHSEMPPHNRMAIIKNSTNNMLVNMWRKGDPRAPLVGLQTGAAPVENSMEIPITKSRYTIWPSNSTTGYFSK